MSAYYFKYFQNIQFKNHGIAPTPPPDLPTLKAYPTPGVGGRFGIFSLKWRERMNLKVPGAILPLDCAILSTRAKTVRGVGRTPLRRTSVKEHSLGVLCSRPPSYSRSLLPVQIKCNSSTGITLQPISMVRRQIRDPPSAKWNCV